MPIGFLQYRVRGKSPSQDAPRVVCRTSEDELAVFQELQTQVGVPRALLPCRNELVAGRIHRDGFSDGTRVPVEITVSTRPYLGHRTFRRARVLEAELLKDLLRCEADAKRVRSVIPRLSEVPGREIEIVVHASVPDMEATVPLVPGNVHARCLGNGFPFHLQAGFRQTPHHGLEFSRRHSTTRRGKATCHVKAVPELVEYIEKEIRRRGDFWRFAPKEECHSTLVAVRHMVLQER